MIYFPKTVRYSFDMTSCIFSTESDTNQIKNSASSRSPSVEYVLNFICEFLSTISTSFADSSFARSAIQRHFGSTLKNEKLKNCLGCSLMQIGSIVTLFKI